MALRDVEPATNNDTSSNSSSSNETETDSSTQSESPEEDTANGTENSKPSLPPDRITVSINPFGTMTAKRSGNYTYEFENQALKGIELPIHYCTSR